MIRYQMPVVVLETGADGARTKFGIILDRDINRQICSHSFSDDLDLPHILNKINATRRRQTTTGTGSVARRLGNVKYKIIKTVKVPAIPMERTTDPVQQYLLLRSLRQQKLRSAISIDKEVAVAVQKYGIPDDHDADHILNQEFDDFFHDHPVLGLVVDTVEFLYLRVAHYLAVFFLCTGLLLAAGHLDWRAPACKALYNVVLLQLLIPAVRYVRSKRHEWGWGKVGVIVIE